jgi:prepilin-type processing-associated H-X9-DG protein
VIADQSRTSPVRIDADRAAGTVEIGWADGHVSTWDAVALRWLCPCAFCRGEAGLPGWLDSRPTLTPDQTRLVDVRLVGQYALQPIWGDGHATGYYAFRLLRERCPCPEDSAARRAADATEPPRPAIPHRHEEEIR